MSQCCSQCCMGEQTERKQKLGRKFCVFKICCLSTQTRKQSRNIPSQCFFSVSQMILRLRQQATYVEDTKFASCKQKILLKFSKNIFLRPGRNFASATMFPRLCRPSVTRYNLSGYQNLPHLHNLYQFCTCRHYRPALVAMM